MKVYRGSASAARTYVEADRSRVDDYYLAEGTGIATRYVATPDGVREAGAMDGDTYERWVAGYDVDTGAARGRLRTDDSAVRFVEIVVNGPKTWSLAASLHPEIAEAYDAAQERAAREIIGWLAEHATTRVGPRGRQVQVPVDEIDVVAVRHYTSRAGDPHRHLHLQVNARVATSSTNEGPRWRGLHTVGVRDSLDALNGIGHAAVMTDPRFRNALAVHGYTLEPTTGEVAELAPYAGAFSSRAAQINRNVDRYEAAWRGEHPGEEPGPVLRRAWDRRAWADARPDKVVPADGRDLARRWLEELHELGFRRPPAPRPAEESPRQPGTLRTGELNRDAVVDLTLDRLGARRSGWNAADVRGEVERILAGTGRVIDPAARGELAEDLTARATQRCVRLLGARDDVPEHVRSLTSARVIAVERDLATRLLDRGEQRGPSRVGLLDFDAIVSLGPDQRRVAEALAADDALLIVEGAAGAGKTRTLAAARVSLEVQDRRMMVLTPTLKAAQVAAEQVGTDAHSVAWLLHQWGYRWDEDGRWAHRDPAPTPSAHLDRGDLVVVDEAGMLDQDTARALLELTDHLAVRVALVGDRHQLPAVGRGGVLDLAERYATDCRVDLDSIRRFTDPAYAELSLRMRRGSDPEEVFDELIGRGQIILHPTEVERDDALARLAAEDPTALVVADTHEQVAHLNGLIRDRRTPSAAPDSHPAVGIVTNAGVPIGVGDRVATRRNDPDLGVANRETWTVLAHDTDGGLSVRGRAGTRHLPSGYVASHVELAYTTTAYGAQGETVETAHAVLGEHTTGASAYVAMTRGSVGNTAHLVAADVDDARRQWVFVFCRNRADLGPTQAARTAREDIDRYGPMMGRRHQDRAVPPAETSHHAPGPSW